MTATICAGPVDSSRGGQSGSHVWWYSARMNEWLKDVDGDAMAGYAAVMPAPTSTLGRRIVTCHADFHAGNLVRDEVSTIRLAHTHRKALAFALKAAPATLERPSDRAFSAIALPGGPEHHSGDRPRVHHGVLRGA